jgi:hypothetical protein
MTRPHGFVVPRARAALILDVVAAVATIHHFGLDFGSHSRPLTRAHGSDIEGTSRAGGIAIVEPDERFSDCAGFARAPV